MAITTGRRPGPTREKLAQKLRDHGFDIDADDIHSTNPTYISAKMGGCCSWEGHGRWLDPRHKVWQHATFQSWSTMTECIRRGFTWTRETDGSGYITVYAKPNPKKENRS